MTLRAKSFVVGFFLAALLASWQGVLHAAERMPISEKEFRALAEELAPKVNLFRETWARDPKAEFYGGTTRDYVFWLKGKFQGVRSRDEMKEIIRKLREAPVIDVREFIIGESDVDIVSESEKLPAARDFGVRKVDALSPEIFDSKSELGKNELNQGHIPAEKIRLGRNGFGKISLGDGVGEIYRGKLTVQYALPEVFEATKYAKEGVNHPVLLSLRYLRLQAINYFHTHGSGYPNRERLLEGMDQKSLKSVREVIESVMDGEALKRHMENPRFVSWINGSIQKAFRSYTNPTAALELMRDFGVEKLPAIYREVEPINQYVFMKHRNKNELEKTLKAYGVDGSRFYQKPESFFSDGYLYHGTRQEQAFRSIIFQGVIASEAGSAGAGLYGVAEKKKEFAEKWGGTKERLLRFPISKDAKIVDLTKGEGKRIWDMSREVHKEDFEVFSDLFGVDILKYPYRSTEAFVVKNAGAVSRGEGVYRRVLTVPELIEASRKEKDPARLLSLLSVNGISRQELGWVWDASPIEKRQILKLIRDEKSLPEIRDHVLFGTHRWISDPDIQDAVYSWFHSKDPKVRAFIRQSLDPESHLDGGKELIPLFPIMKKMFADPKARLNDDRMSNLFKFFSEHQLASPEVTQKAVDFVERSHRGEGFNGWHGVVYLKNAILDESQKKRLFEVYDTGSGSRGSLTDLAEILHQSSHEPEKIVAKLESGIESFENLAALLRIRPGNPVYESKAMERINDLVSARDTSHLEETMEVFSLLKKNRNVANSKVMGYFLSGADELQSELAPYLIEAGLGRSDLLKICTPGVMIDPKSLKSLSEHLGRKDPEFLDKALWAYYLSQGSQDEFRARSKADLMIDFFNGYSPIEQQRVLKQIAVHLASIDKADTRYFDQLYRFLAKWKHPLPLWLQERILDDLESRRVLFTYDRTDLVSVMKKLDFGVRSVSDRFQRLYSSGKILEQVGMSEAAEHFVRLSPEYAKFLQKRIHLYRGNGTSWGPDAANELEKILQRFEMGCHSKVKASLAKAAGR